MSTSEEVSGVSLARIINKIIGDEKLLCDQYLTYIYYLLEIAAKDHLQGLSLDNLEYDIPQQILKPELQLLIPSRATKVSDHPFSWYIDSVWQLQSDSKDNLLHQKALVWNIIALKASIYLLALPELENQPKITIKKEKEKEYKGHVTTVKRLFEKFRKANKALNIHKKYKKTDEYRSLWNQHLPSPEIDLDDFVSHLEYQSKLEELSQFEKNLLNDLRVIFSYVLHHKVRNTGTHEDKTLELIYLDEDKSVKQTLALPKKGKSYAEKLEVLADTQSDRQIQVNLKQVSELADNSETAAHYAQRLVDQHIKKNEHQHTCTNFFPNPTSISYILSKLYENYLEHHTTDNSAENPNANCALVLMLSFITGNPVSEWLKIQNKRVRRLNLRQKLVEDKNQFFLYTQFSIFSDSDHPFPEAFINQTTALHLPIPRSFILSLRENPAVSEAQVNQYSKKLRDKLYIPHLSSLKVSSLLHHTILNNTANKQLADLLTGIDTNRSASLSYCHYPLPVLKAAYIDTLETLCQSLAMQYQTLQFDIETNQNFGSIKAPKREVVQELYSVLKYNIFSQGQDLLATFNHYNVWLWHVLLLLTAARPVSEFPGFLKHWDFEKQILIVSDKEVGNRQSHGRLIPFGNFIKNEVKKFIQFLKFLHLQLSCENIALAQYVQDIFDSKRPLLNIYTNKKLETLKPSLVKKNQPELGLRHDNWHRHTTRAFLTGKVSEPAILALFAHENMQQESAHLYSSFSMSEYRNLADTLESMIENFKITGIELDVLLQEF